MTYPLTLRDQHSPGSMQSRNQPGIKNRIEHFYLLAGMLPQLNQILAPYFTPFFPFLDRCVGRSDLSGQALIKSISKIVALSVFLDTAI